MRHFAALVLLVSAAALPAHGQLVEVDLSVPGDRLVTRDTDTGLDWLEIGGVTTGLSVDDVLAGAGGWLPSGWRYATLAEVCHLFSVHAALGVCIAPLHVLGAPPAAAYDLFDRLKATQVVMPSFTERHALIVGLYDDETGGPAAGEAILTLGESVPPGFLWQLGSSAEPDFVLTDTAELTRGSFLVRASPPVVPALPPAGTGALAAALLALGALARRPHLCTRGVR